MTGPSPREERRPDLRRHYRPGPGRVESLVQVARLAERVGLDPEWVVVMAAHESGICDPVANARAALAILRREPRPGLRDLAEAAVSACLPLMPLEGSWDSGYTVSDYIDPKLQATVPEWSDAAHAIAELHEALRRHG